MQPSPHAYRSSRADRSTRVRHNRPESGVIRAVRFADSLTTAEIADLLYPAELSPSEWGTTGNGEPRVPGRCALSSARRYPTCGKGLEQGDLPGASHQGGRGCVAGPGAVLGRAEDVTRVVQQNVHRWHGASLPVRRQNPPPRHWKATVFAPSLRTVAW